MDSFMEPTDHDHSASVFITPMPDGKTPFQSSLTVIPVVATHVEIITPSPNGLRVFRIAGFPNPLDERYALVNGKTQIVDPYDSWERSRMSGFKCTYDLRIKAGVVWWEYLTTQYYGGVMDKEHGVNLAFVNDRELVGESSASIDYWLKHGGDGMTFPG